MTAERPVVAFADEPSRASALGAYLTLFLGWNTQIPSGSLRASTGDVRRMEQDAAPARLASSAGLPGCLGAPPYGHYDPCARSSLDGFGAGSRPEVRKRGPG